MTLYLKYRPKNLNELDLPEVSESLKKILTSGKIPHAFLFAGPKGTGKTSAARILAKVINCENLGKDGIPCEKCEQCTSINKGSNLDVVEMDAASHRGIDDVRTLKDAINLAPAHSRKKIYIIDEAHMLTTEASNALLKTLEEPPEHVIFVLATTNPEKLIATIRSRVTLIPFRKATPVEIVRSLKRVTLGEKIEVQDDALLVIAEVAGGAFRDAIKILEQLVTEQRDLTKEFLEKYLLISNSSDTAGFIDLLVARNMKALLAATAQVESSGIPIDSFLDEIIRELRQILLASLEKSSISLSVGEIIEVIELLMDASTKITTSAVPELPLEIAIIKWCDVVTDTGPRKNRIVDINNDEKVTNNSSIKNVDDLKEYNEQVLTSQISGVQISEPSLVNDETWKIILSLVKPINASVEALLRAAKPMEYDGKTLTLGVFYRFHKERLEDMHHRMILEEIIGKVLKTPTKVVCTLVEPPPKKVIEEAKERNVLTEGKDADIIKVAEEIFGN